MFAFTGNIGYKRYEQIKAFSKISKLNLKFILYFFEDLLFFEKVTVPKFLKI